MEHQTDNTQHIERANNDDSFEIFKPKILMAIDKIKGKKEREIHLVFLNKVKTLSQDIPSTMKQFVLVGKRMC